jgi:intracellular sulfur oxidation DsrE/DsrF family protein
MNDNTPISEELLNAFIDGELDATEKSEVFEALGKDTTLSQQVCELRQLSELVRHAYDKPPESAKYCKPEPRRMSMWGRAASATLLVGLGAMLGWGGSHQPSDQQAEPGGHAVYWDKDHALQNTELSKITDQQGTKRVIVHLNTSSIAKFERALDTAEKLLETYADSELGAEVEVVTNASAVKMLRTGYSPYAERVRALQERYLNLTFLACKDAIDHVRELENLEAGVTLLPDVDVTQSALEHILNRLSEGWVYINV